MCVCLHVCVCKRDCMHALEQGRLFVLQERNLQVKTHVHSYNVKAAIVEDLLLYSRLSKGLFLFAAT
jgi:hypothetical protein